MLVFAMGGSSRADAQSLVFLNPLIVFLTGIALLTFRTEYWYTKKVFLVSSATIFLLVGFYVVPLPFVQSVHGPDILGASRRAAEMPNMPLGFAIAPAGVWQSLFSLFAPLAVFLFAIQTKRDDLFPTLSILILLGTISGLFGLLQLIGSDTSSLYLYSITNNGSAVGLFANRNHAAVLLACLFPMLVVFAVSSRSSEKGKTYARRLIATAIALILVPLILITGSRSGMLIAMIGLIGGTLLYATQSSTDRQFKVSPSKVPIFVSVAVTCLVFATIYFSRAESIDRFFWEPRTVQDRDEFWVSSLRLFGDYFPFGFGAGSFPTVFQVDEPVALLNGRHVNRLHNDWLETALAFGIPGIIFMAGSVVYYLRRTFLLWARMDGTRQAVLFGRMASIVIAMIAVASISDYPLRTPAMMGVAALVIFWFAEAGQEHAFR